MRTSTTENLARPKAATKTLSLAKTQRRKDCNSFGKGLVVLAALALGLEASALNFDGVKGGDELTAPFTRLNDNDLAGRSASGWFFKSAVVSGGMGIKEAAISSNEELVSTSTTSGAEFNYVTFTIIVRGDITTKGKGKGPMPTYSLTGERRGALAIEPKIAHVGRGLGISFKTLEKLGDTEVGDMKSHWRLSPPTYKVYGEDYTQSPSVFSGSDGDGAETCFVARKGASYANRVFPDPGDYEIEARPANKSDYPAGVWPNELKASLTVVGGEFMEKGGTPHPVDINAYEFGFDDYTGWVSVPGKDKHEDYYGGRKGYCRNAHISCPRHGDNHGHSHFRLAPAIVSPAKINFNKSGSRLSLSSESTNISCNLSFNARGDAKISAILEAPTAHDELATLEISSFKQEEAKVLVVFVYYQGEMTEDRKKRHRLTRNFEHAEKSVELAKKIFKQCVMLLDVWGTYFQYVREDNQASWSIEDIRALRDAFQRERKEHDKSFDNVVFIVIGNDIDGSVLGRGEYPGKYSWIFDYFGFGERTMAHEIGHNYNLPDLYEYIPGQAPKLHEDLHNLMNVGNARAWRIRKHQWNIVRERYYVNRKNK